MIPEGAIACKNKQFTFIWQDRGFKGPYPEQKISLLLQRKQWMEFFGATRTILPMKQVEIDGKKICRIR